MPLTENATTLHKVRRVEILLSQDKALKTQKKCVCLPLRSGILSTTMPDSQIIQLKKMFYLLEERIHKSSGWSMDGVHQDRFAFLEFSGIPEVCFARMLCFLEKVRRTFKSELRKLGTEATVLSLSCDA